MGSAIYFIIFLGIVSLFADITYEGARGVIGPYLLTIGASGAAVGLIIGMSEFLGYALRGVSGFLADKTKSYWTLTLIGYCINLISIPLLAVAGHWQTAALLIALERVGKSIRVPPRDAMLSFASKKVGRGFGFGLHESLDRVGAILGPLAFGLILYFHKSYQFGFAMLAIPAAIALLTLFLAKRLFPSPEKLEIKHYSLKAKGLSKPYWIYILATGLVALGFTSFAIISYYFTKTGKLSAPLIPIFYAMANGVSGLGSLIMGRIFDRHGITFLAFITALSALFVPLVFLGSYPIMILGLILWGIGLGAQGSLQRAVIAHLVSPESRGSAYGIFNLIFGLSGAIGSILMGYFLDFSLTALILFSLLTQLLSIPLFYHLRIHLK